MPTQVMVEKTRQIYMLQNLLNKNSSNWQAKSYFKELPYFNHNTIDSKHM